MIGAVGMPKPDYINDPVYTDVDYGSAYDMVTDGKLFCRCDRVGGCHYESFIYVIKIII